ncbi:hypothetical protein B0J12DRAFT_372589 [Macrophomina phaseolina]|uniref:Uncharacterized protein n=1 Tax=Macrophomina phaseolina TaxID=35725 RepID=A0ABQ8GK49_9PEZI|nr:hypothetical protein B0J12DRAFT_372589 [Macrophomina phaseolina]
MHFTRIRLSSSPAASPHVVDAPSSPTKSVYVNMDGTMPPSPPTTTNLYTLSNNVSSKTNIPDTTTTSNTVAAAPASSPPITRRTNFFDSDSSSDEDKEDENDEDLTTADEFVSSQHHSFTSSPSVSLIPDANNNNGDGIYLAPPPLRQYNNGTDGDQHSRGRPLTRSPPPLLLASHHHRSPSIKTYYTTSTNNSTIRKGAYYLGVRPEDYAFVCGTRPASSVGGGVDDDDDEEEASVYPPDDHYYHQQNNQQQGRGRDGYARYDVLGAEAMRGEEGEEKREREHRRTLMSEGASTKRVPFATPDLAVAARRVLRDRRKVIVRGLGRGRASSSALGWVAVSASKYEEGLRMGERVGSDEESGDVCASGEGGVGGSDTAAAAAAVDRRSDAVDDLAETQSLQSKTHGNILGVHAITLQALLRNEEGRQVSAPSEFSGREILKLQSKLAPQQPQKSATSSAPLVPETSPIAQIQQPKRVAVVPPPIDTRNSRSSRSDSKVKTPYPFHHHKNIPKALGRPEFLPPAEVQDTVLTLSIRRRRGVLSSRVARISLPAELLEGNCYATAAANGFRCGSDGVALDEKPITPAIFDDAAFFKHLRAEYARLAGRWWRFFSARSLRRITIGHATAWSAAESCPVASSCGGGHCCLAARAAHGGDGGQLQHQLSCSAAVPGGIYHVRSPRFLARQGLKDTFSEENLLAGFRNPRTGRGRFAWVLWASRLAGLHEQPDLSGWGAAQRGRNSRVAKHWRQRDLRPTPDGVGGRGTGGSSSGGRWVDASGRTPSTASTAFAVGGSDNDCRSKRGDDIVGGAGGMAELGLATAGIGPRHSIATLEFMEGWSVGRIVAAVLLMLLLAAAGIVLWILFGSGILIDEFRGSDARVGTAVLIGAVVLLFGWTLVLAWMGVSWCVV